MILLGTYTRRDSKGIMALNLTDLSTQLVHQEQACTYLVEKNKQVFSVFKDEQGGGILILDSKGQLVDKVYSKENSASCHIAIHPTLDILATTNYGEGSCQFFIKEEGQWKLAKRHIEEEGSHQHFVYFSTTHDHIIICDLGLNQLVTYNYDFEKISVHQFQEDIGPRHFVTNDKEDYFYLLCELSNELLVLHREDFEYNIIQRESLLEDPVSQGNNSAAIRMSKDGRFIYASVRNNEESIVVFEIKDHLVTKIQTISSHGKHPRDINLSKDENFLLVANKDSDNVVFFKRDGSGLLVYDKEVKVSEPVCILV